MHTSIAKQLDKEYSKYTKQKASEIVAKQAILEGHTAEVREIAKACLNKSFKKAARLIYKVLPRFTKADRDMNPVTFVECKYNEERKALEYAFDPSDKEVYIPYVLVYISPEEIELLVICSYVGWGEECIGKYHREESFKCTPS